jgi:hypothetical protein
MIRNASELKEATMKNEHYEKGYKQAVESVMRAIERASQEGRRKTCFNPSAYWYVTESGVRTFMRFDDEVKVEFKKHGYRFEPTGYIGGVLQRTENICW